MIKIYFDEIAASGIDYPNNSQTTDGKRLSFPIDLTNIRNNI